MHYVDDEDDFHLSQALAQAQAADKEARSLRARKCWGEELAAVEDIARAAWQRVAAIRRRIIYGIAAEEQRAQQRFKLNTASARDSQTG